jgi:hypothetical protein
MPPDDPGDPDDPPPYDEDGHFAGWMSETEQAAVDAQFAGAAEAMAGHGRRSGFDKMPMASARTWV